MKSGFWHNSGKQALGKPPKFGPIWYRRVNISCASRRVPLELSLVSNMPKRNHATEDDDEPVSISSKRARTADSDQEEEDLPRTGSKRIKKGKGKGRTAKGSDDDQDDLDDQEEEADEDEDDEDIKPQVPEMDEEQLDAQYGAAIRAQLENKKKVQGVSIESVPYIIAEFTLCAGCR